MTSPLSFLTLPTRQGPNLPVMSFIIFQVFLEAPCILFCISLFSFSNLSFLEASLILKIGLLNFFAKSFHLSFEAADFLWCYHLLALSLLVKSVGVTLVTHFLEPHFGGFSITFCAASANISVMFFGIVSGSPWSCETVSKQVCCSSSYCWRVSGFWVALFQSYFTLSDGVCSSLMKRIWCLHWQFCDPNLILLN